MQKNHVVRYTGTKSEELERVLNDPPDGYELHIVVPFAITQHGTDQFLVIFRLIIRIGHGAGT